MRYEIAIIGGGPGGYVAAIRASQMGAKVALIRFHLAGLSLKEGLNGFNIINIFMIPITVSCFVCKLKWGGLIRC